MGSSFRVGAIVYAIFFAIFGLFSILLQLLVLTPFLSMSSSSARGVDFSLFAGAGLLSFACFYLVGIAAAAIIGGISAAILAWAYNLAARWVGGIKLQFDSDGSGDLLDEIGRDLDSRRNRGE